MKHASNSLRRTFIVSAISATLLASAQAATVIWSADAFDADADISTQGTLVKAANLGSTTAVTVNGVNFAGDPASTASFFTTTATDFADPNLYLGGAIGSLTLTETQALLQNTEFGGGVGNSLARLTGLTIGQQYQVQVLIVNDRSAVAGQTVSLGYAALTGSATEVYPLTGVDVTGSAGTPQVKVFTGTFTADQTSQDLHIAFSGNTNGEASAFQLRAVPEPAAALLGSLGLLALLRRRRA